MKAIPLNGYEPTEIPEQYDPEVIFGADYVYYDKGGLILKDKAKISEIIQPDSDYTDNYFLLRDNYKNGKPLLILNVGSGKDLTIKDLALKIAYHVDYKGNIIWNSNKPDGTPRKLLNIEKIKSLGWVPKIELDDGIVQTIELFKNKNKNKSDDFYL